MMETGPWRVDGKGGLKIVENGWEEYTHVIYGELYAQDEVLCVQSWRSRSAAGYRLLVYGHRQIFA